MKGVSYQTKKGGKRMAILAECPVCHRKQAQNRAIEPPERPRRGDPPPGREKSIIESGEIGE